MDGMHLYEYVNGLPIGFMDPSGLAAIGEKCEYTGASRISKRSGRVWRPGRADLLGFVVGEYINFEVATCECEVSCKDYDFRCVYVGDAQIAPRVYLPNYGLRWVRDPSDDRTYWKVYSSDRYHASYQDAVADLGVVTQWLGILMEEIVEDETLKLLGGQLLEEIKEAAIMLTPEEKRELVRRAKALQFEQNCDTACNSLKGSAP